MVTKNIFWILMIILTIGSVNAFSLSLEYDYYMEFNTTETINTYFRHTNNSIITNETGLLQIVFDSTTYNMSFNPSSNMWYVNVIEDVTEGDTTFVLNGYNDVNGTGSIVVTESGTMRWRIPFNVTIDFYMDNLQNQSPEQMKYTSQFDYVYLREYPEEKLRWQPLFDFTYLDSWFGWVPFYKKGQITKNYDLEVSFWGEYVDGRATIKLYNEHNYSVYIMRMETIGGSWGYEFIKPQHHDSVFDTKVVDGDLELINKSLSPKSYNINIDTFELGSMFIMKNILLIIVYVSFYLTIVFLVSLIDKSGRLVALVGTALFPVLLYLIKL